MFKGNTGALMIRCSLETGEELTIIVFEPFLFLSSCAVCQVDSE